ncbi:hypothetical protein CF327_g1922 [Tilletia walkeri]|nr:hypothetical protein CF327_g1922 [Tilletia walkeri]
MSLADEQQDRYGKTVATIRSASEDDSGDEVEDDPVRQGAARRRTVTQRRQATSATTLRTTWYRQDRTGDDARTNNSAQLLLRHGKTRTETAVGSAAISPSQYSKTTASDFTEETKPSGQEGGWTASVRGEVQGSERRDQGPPPTGKLAAGAPRRQTDGERSRGLAGQEPEVPRDRADSDSDGKGSKTKDDTVEKTGSVAGPVVQDLQHSGDGTDGPSRRRDDSRRLPRGVQAGAGRSAGRNAFIRRIGGPRSASYGDGFSRCVRTTARAARERQDGHRLTEILTYQEKGLTAPRTVKQAQPLTKSARRHGKHVRPNELLGRKGAGRLRQGHGRMAPQVRYVNTRRRTGTAQTVRRDGKTTGGNLTTRAKLVREEEGGRFCYEGSERRDEGPPPIGTACGPQASRDKSQANSYSDGKRRNARSLASTATVEQGSKTEDASVEQTGRVRVSRRLPLYLRGQDSGKVRKTTATAEPCALRRELEAVRWAVFDSGARTDGKPDGKTYHKVGKYGRARSKGMRTRLAEYGAGSSKLTFRVSPVSWTTGKQSPVTSILSLGAFAGSLMGAPILDAVGRRPGVWIALVIFSIGVIMQTAATTAPLFAGGRVVAGLSVGIVSTIVPMYQSETAPRWIRGAVVSAYQWAITIGLLVAAIVNKGTSNINGTGCYRIPISIQLGFGGLLGVLFFLIPESPHWLIKRQRREDACKVLARMYSTTADDEVVQAEAYLIENNLQIELSVSTDSYLDCFKPKRKYLARTLTGIFLQAWQQLTGINFIFYYGTTFFQSALPKSDPFAFTIISNVVNVVSTVPGMWGMERFGCRPLLFYGALWMTVCEYVVAIIGTTRPSSDQAAGRSLVAFVCLYIAAFASTWGPGAWVVCGEIFPLAIRAKSLSLCVASNWLWNFAIGYATPYLVQKGHGYAGLGAKVFFIWQVPSAATIISD